MTTSGVSALTAEHAGRHPARGARACCRRRTTWVSPAPSYGRGRINVARAPRLQ